MATTAPAVIGAVIGAAFYVGGTLSAINANLAEMKGSVGEMKGSIDKLQATTYDLNGTTKAQGERLKSMDEQLKDVRTSLREAAKAGAEASDKMPERLAGFLDAFEKRMDKGRADLAGKLDMIERKVDDASDVLVIWLTLTGADRPIARTETSLTYYRPIPAQQRQKVIRIIQSKAILDGVVSLFDGDLLLRPPGVTATAQPMKDDGRLPIQLFFQDKTALEGFEKLLGQLTEARKGLRLKITLTLG